jgi:putative DNA primase/helicase
MQGRKLAVLAGLAGCAAIAHAQYVQTFDADNGMWQTWVSPGNEPGIAHVATGGVNDSGHVSVNLAGINFEGPLAKLAAEYNVAVVVVAHQRKATGTNADDLVMGSRAFTGLARSVMHVMSDPDDPSRRLLLPGKNNLAPPQSGLAFTIGSKLTWHEESIEFTADDVLRRQNSARGGDDGNRTVVDDAADFLTELLSTGPMAAASVYREAKGAGFSKSAIEKAKARLKVKSEKVSGEQHGGWVWSMPEVLGP